MKINIQQALFATLLWCVFCFIFHVPIKAGYDYLASVNWSQYFPADEIKQTVYEPWQHWEYLMGGEVHYSETNVDLHFASFVFGFISLILSFWLHAYAVFCLGKLVIRVWDKLGNSIC